MIEFFKFISTIANFLFEFISFPVLIVNSLADIVGFVNSTAMLIHPTLGAFVFIYTGALMAVSLILPLLRDFF